MSHVYLYWTIADMLALLHHTARTVLEIVGCLREVRGGVSVYDSIFINENGGQVAPLINKKISGGLTRNWTSHFVETFIFGLLLSRCPSNHSTPLFLGFWCPINLVVALINMAVSFLFIQKKKVFHKKISHYVVIW